MQDDKDKNAKQAIVERIKSANSILVTVSRDPSVDSLSAAIGFSLMLNKMGKHATTVFSGQTPPAITFLEPDKRFEHTVDSLRDFIIALDKEKADRLRYKVEDDVVRIFITPYRTTISEKDLQFSQGDFNVDLIIALGVDKREDLDIAITAHGRILHDATIVTINTDGVTSSLGIVDWVDTAASSLCEMLVGMSESLQANLLDEQIATALLTGIVSATDRFSNTHTSPQVMTMAAQLMAAGANQQLIATKLMEGHALSTASQPTPQPSQPIAEKPATQTPEPVAEASDGEMQITHDASAETSPGTSSPTVALSTSVPSEDLTLETAIAPAGATLSVADLKKDLAAASQDVEAAAQLVTAPSTAPLSSGWRDRSLEPPSMGGTLNATTYDEEQRRREEEQSMRNHRILSHDAPVVSHEPKVDVTTLHEPVLPTTSEPLAYEATPEPTPPSPSPTIAELERQAHESVPSGSDLDAARAAVDQALGAPIAPPPLTEQPSPATDQPAPETLMAPGEPTLTLPPPPPLPDFSTLPPLPEPLSEPPALSSSHPAVESSPVPMPPVTPPDPGQFKIPGQ